jgi:hypothetical protein
VEEDMLLILDIISTTQITSGGITLIQGLQVKPSLNHYFDSMLLYQNVGCEHKVWSEL